MPSDLANALLAGLSQENDDGDDDRFMRQAAALSPEDLFFGPDEETRHFAEEDFIAFAEHKFSTTQFDLSDKQRAGIIALGKKIPDEDLAEDGREDKPHITILWGLHSDDPDAVEDVVKSFGQVTVNLGAVSFFPASGDHQFDVLIVKVDGQSIRDLNRLMSQRLEHASTHPSYEPHATIAYLKAGLGEKYAAAMAAPDEEITFDELVFSNRDREKTIISLTGAFSESLESFAEPVYFDEIYHGPKPPGPGWLPAGVGPRGGKMWKPGPHAKSQHAPAHKPEKQRGHHQDEFEKVLNTIGTPDGGFTYQPIDHRTPKTGYPVSIYPERSFAVKGEDLTPEVVAEYALRNVDILGEPGNFTGGWHDPKTDIVYLDCTVVANTPEEAKALCLKHDQIAYFDLANGQSVEVNPGATSGAAATPDPDPWAHEPHGKPLKLKPAPARAFNGSPVPIKTQISKPATGKLGERVILAWLRSKGQKAYPLNLARNNFPIDIVQPDANIECKAGLVSVTRGAQQWNLKIGEPGPLQQEEIAKMSDADKLRMNGKKRKMIHARKEKVVHDCERITGKEIKRRTITCILNPDTRTVDLYDFPPGAWHDSLGWNSPEVKAAYAESVQYEEPVIAHAEDVEPMPPAKAGEPMLHDLSPEAWAEFEKELKDEGEHWLEAATKFFKEQHDGQESEPLAGDAGRGGNQEAVRGPDRQEGDAGADGQRREDFGEGEDQGEYVQVPDGLLGAGQLAEVMARLDAMGKQMEQAKADARTQLAVIPKPASDPAMVQALQQLAVVVKEIAGRQAQPAPVAVPDQGPDTAQSILALAQAVTALASKPAPRLVKTTKNFKRDREGNIISPVEEVQEFE
jgi:hypothetical protein